MGHSSYATIAPSLTLTRTTAAAEPGINHIEAPSNTPPLNAPLPNPIEAFENAATTIPMPFNVTRTAAPARIGINQTEAPSKTQPLNDCDA